MANPVCGDDSPSAAENLEALRAAGAKLVAISALTSTSLPDGLDALYIGGGFPETHAETLSRN